MTHPLRALPIDGASKLFINTRLGPPLGTGGFVNVLVLDAVMEIVDDIGLAVDLATVFLGSFVGDIFRVAAAIFPPLIAGDILPDFPTKTFSFGLLLFSFSASADERGRGVGSSLVFPLPFPCTVGCFFAFGSKWKTRPFPKPLLPVGLASIAMLLSRGVHPSPPSSSVASSETTASGPEVGDKESSETSLFRGGLRGESDNIRIRLRGLGLAGEYA